jgi:hypothetical protein
LKQFQSQVKKTVVDLSCGGNVASEYWEAQTSNQFSFAGFNSYYPVDVETLKMFSS